MMPLCRCFGLLIGLGLSWLGITHATGQVPEEQARATELRQKNLASFKMVWETVRDKHFDPKLGGLDWEQVRKEVEPKVAAAKSVAEARGHLTDMLQRLGQSHFGIFPNDVQRELTAKPKPASGQGGKDQNESDDDLTPLGGDGEPGFQVRIVGDDALVVKVDPEGPARRAGVKAGWIVKAIDGHDISPMLARVRKAYEHRVGLELLATIAVHGRLQGAIHRPVEVVFIDGDDNQVKLKIPRAAPKGEPHQFGNLPTFHVHLDARTLEGNIGYLHLSAFFDPVRVMPQVEKAVAANAKAAGFILDLRGNPGGVGLMAVGVGNWFVDEPNQKLGTLITRTGSLHFVLNPRVGRFVGPLAVLVDGCSASTSEILAGGLQDIKRARLFGSRTAGAALPSQILRLPNGDGFQYAFANYVSAGGKELEKNGVIPDQVVPLDRAALLAGRDPVLDAAVQWIQAQARDKSGE